MYQKHSHPIVLMVRLKCEKTTFYKKAKQTEKEQTEKIQNRTIPTVLHL